MSKRRAIPLHLVLLYGVVMLVLASAFGAMAETVKCRIDVNGDKVCSDGSRTRTDVNGDERKTS